MKVNPLVHQRVMEENIKLKKENGKLLQSIEKDSQRVKLAGNIVNRFYQIKPIILEKKGAFRFDKWNEIVVLIQLTDKFKSINNRPEGTKKIMSKL